MKKTKQSSGKIIGIVLVVAVFAAIIYFFVSSSGSGNEIPPYVTGETRAVYAWAQTAEGAAILEQLPCYCGCKYEGHKHARHCFWRDDGSFDKHGITCSVCLDIGRKAMAMQAEGSDICTIRNDVDTFYAPNAHLGTDTPMPVGCSTE